jgi:hypothetical protein
MTDTCIRCGKEIIGGFYCNECKIALDRIKEIEKAQEERNKHKTQIK